MPRSPKLLIACALLCALPVARADDRGAPELGEWKSAKEVALARPLPDTCKAHKVRAWYRIRCTTPSTLPASGTVLSGSAEGVSFYIWRPGPTDTTESAPFIEVIFPVKKGDQRIIQLTAAGDTGYGGVWSQSPLILISEQWIDTEEPILVASAVPIRGPLHGLRLGGEEEAKRRGVKNKRGGHVIVDVVKGSVADKAGAKVGYVLLNRRDEVQMHHAVEDEDGDTVGFQFLKQSGTPLLIRLPTGRH